jgi:selenide,water dikinase
LKSLASPLDPNVLVGIEHSDDAAVYKVRDDLAIVATTDFFTPIVDDPYYFGAIAAANALSDIWAMGARPLFALNLVGFPDKDLPLETLKSILLGGSDKAHEAGIHILGGHTIKDREPKYGLVVIGLIHPDRVVANSTAQPGDRLILTKPIGTGIISTAIKQGKCPKEVECVAVETMCRLNKTAGEIMQEFSVSACTDVTGFGLLGHLREMVLGSGVGAVLYAERVPVLPGTLALVKEKAVPGGTRANLKSLAATAQYSNDITEEMKIILNDAQTSGGLLIAVPEARSRALLDALHQAGVNEAALIGELTSEPVAKIRVVCE